MGPDPAAAAPFGQNGVKAARTEKVAHQARYPRSLRIGLHADLFP